MNVELRINGRRIQDWDTWPGTVITVRRDTEALTLAAQLENIKLIGADAAFVASQPTAVLNVELTHAGETVRGRVYPGEVRYGRDYVVLSAELDGTTLFTRLVEGRLLDESVRRDVRVLVSPREDKALVLTLVVSIFIVTYITVNEVFDVAKTTALIGGITGAGVGGPVSGPIAAAIIAVLRIVYIAALVLALVELVRELIRLADRIITVRGFRLGDALRYFASQAGMQVQYPSWLDSVWIIGGGIEAWEGGEVFRIAKALTNSYLLVQGTTVRLVQQGGDFPAALRRAWEEVYRLNLLDIPRRQLVSLVRDTAEAHCMDIPAAVEIARTQGRGFARVDIPLAPAATSGRRREVEIIRKFLNALARFSQRVRNVQAQYQGYENLIVVERDIFTPKVVYASDPEDVSPENARTLLQLVAERYRNIVARRVIEDITVPLSAAEFAQLLQQGFPGVEDMRYYPAEERAEITYSYRDTAIALNETIRIV